MYYHVNVRFSCLTLITVLLVAARAVCQGSFEPVLKGGVYSVPADASGVTPMNVPDLIRTKGMRFANGFGLNLAGVAIDQFGSIEFKKQGRQNFLLDANNKPMSMYFTQPKPTEAVGADKIQERSSQLKRVSEGMAQQEVTSILGKYDDMFQRISPDKGFEEVWLYTKARGSSEMTLLWFDSKGTLVRKDVGDLASSRQSEEPRKSSTSPVASNVARETQAPQRAHARHILVAVAATDSPEAKKTKLLKAEDIRRQLLNGADFSETARKFSDCHSKARGGDLGVFTKGVMVKPFEDAAFTQNVGEIGPVIETAFGYHIIQVLDDKGQPAPQLGGQQTITQTPNKEGDTPLDMQKMTVGEDSRQAAEQRDWENE